MKKKHGSGYANRRAQKRSPERREGIFADYNAHLKWYYYSTYHPIGFLDPELTLRDYRNGLSIPDAIALYAAQVETMVSQTGFEPVMPTL